MTDRTPRRIFVAYSVLVVIALLIAGSYFYTSKVDHAQADRTARAQCAAVTQVRDAINELTKPVSTQGVSDAATLERIKIANAARVEAQRILDRKLACSQ